MPTLRSAACAEAAAAAMTNVANDFSVVLNMFPPVVIMCPASRMMPGLLPPVLKNRMRVFLHRSGDRLLDDLVRQAHVIFGDAGAGRQCADAVCGLGLLDALRERVMVEPMQYRGHPPGKAFRLPDPPQTDLGIALQHLGMIL